MRYLVRFLPTPAPRGLFLPSVRRLAASVGADARNPKWTSIGSLELDIFCKTGADFEMFLAATAPLAKPEFVTDLNRAPEHMAEVEVFSRARDLFNAERYWECHEALEGVWRIKQGEEKTLLAGIILVCAAFVHHQKGEEQVALGILRRASKQLEYPGPLFGGFDLQTLRTAVLSV